MIIKPKFIEPKLLLHPVIPDPLHGTNPRTIFGRGWWEWERKKTYLKNNYHCWVCGTHQSKAKYYKRLEAHETYDIDYNKGIMTFNSIVALCYCCHNYIHSGRLYQLLQSNKICKRRYDTIIKHGNNILKKHNLYKQNII